MATGKTDDIISRKSQTLYITLIRTFGIISITIPLVLFFVNEFVYELSLILMMALGAILILFSMVWGYMEKRSGRHSQFVED